MTNIKISVMNGDVGVGDRIFWHSKRFGVRKGKVVKICEESGWMNNRHTYLSALPDKKEGEYCYSQVPLKNFNYICKEFTPQQVA